VGVAGGADIPRAEAPGKAMVPEVATRGGLLPRLEDLWCFMGGRPEGPLGLDAPPVMRG